MSWARRGLATAVLCVGCLGTLVLGGCGTGPSTAAPRPAAPAVAPGSPGAVRAAGGVAPPPAPSAGSASKAAPFGAPAPGAVVTLAEVGASPVYAPIWVGILRGFFKQYGVNVHLKAESSSAAAMAALEKGSAQLVAGGGSLVAADPGGRRLAFVGALANRYVAWKLMAVPGVSSVADLRGRTVGALGRGSPDAAVLATLLRRAGLNPSRDVRWLYASGTARLLADLHSGRIAAALLSWPTYRNPTAASLRTLVDTESVYLPGPQATLAASRAWAAANSLVLTGFLKGLVAATALAQRDPTSVEQAVGRSLKVSNLSSLRDMYDRFRGAWADPPLVSRAAVAEAIREAVGADAPGVSAAAPPSRYIDDGDVRALVSSGFVTQIQSS